MFERHAPRCLALSALLTATLPAHAQWAIDYSVRAAAGWGARRTNRPAVIARRPHADRSVTGR